MKNLRNSGLAMLVVAFGSAWGGIPATDPVDGRAVASSMEAPESALGECLALDTQKHYSSGAIGGKDDDHYPMNGKTITHVELNVDVKANVNDPLGIFGHGDAKITKQDSTEVVVHYWYDLYTDLDYTLKVWVEC